MTDRCRGVRVFVSGFVIAAPLVVTLPQLCNAQSTAPATASGAPQSAADREQARLHFDAGVRLAQALQWSDAIRELEASRAIRSTASVQFNLGLAYRAVGRKRDAIAAFDAYLAGAGPADSDRVTMAQSYLATLRAEVAHLSVRVTPETANVTLDGAPFPDATQPHELDPGPHSVMVASLGFRPESLRVDLAPGQSEQVEVRLEPVQLSGRLQVQSNIERAVIVIDGRIASHGSADVQLPPGRHVVAASADGYAPFRAEVTLVTNGTSRVNATLSANRTILSSPWLWGAVGAVVIGVGVGVAVYVVAGNNGPAPFQGRYGHVSDALGARP